MEWFVGGLVVVVLGLAAVAGSGRFGSMPPPVHDSPVIELPDTDLRVDYIRQREGLQYHCGLLLWCMQQRHLPERVPV